MCECTALLSWCVGPPASPTPHLPPPAPRLPQDNLLAVPVGALGSTLLSIDGVGALLLALVLVSVCVG